MPDTLTTNSPVIAAYRAATPGSAAQALRAAELFPSGITHDSRYIEPYGLYIARAAGPAQMGCRRALLCRLFRRARRAAARALPPAGDGGGARPARPRHPLRRQPRARDRMGRARQGADPDGRAGALHLIRHRGDADGGAARPRLQRQAQAHPLQLSFPRLARPHDLGPQQPFRRHARRPACSMRSPAMSCLCDQNDEAALARLLEQHDDIAAAIIEPTGANGGKLPIDPDFLHALRRLTAEHGVLLIFDEVVNGFRVAPGGAQEAYGIRPDLTTLAKILAGGLPGGAVTGRKDILDLLDFQVTEGGRQGKDRPSRHLQRQPALGGGGDRMPADRARDRRLRARQPLWRRICAGGSTRSSRKSVCRGRPTARFRRSSCSPTPSASRSPRPGSTRCNIPPPASRASATPGSCTSCGWHDAPRGRSEQPPRRRHLGDAWRSRTRGHRRRAAPTPCAC